MIKRSILSALQKHLQEKEITMLVGPRQAGKTYLMKMLQKELDAQGEKTLFLSLDLEEDRQFFVSQNALLSKIKLSIKDNKGFVFIDEIQRKENAGLFLKGIFDLSLPYKFIVSGSGSLELKEKIHESLAGRKRVFEIRTLTFLEFVDFKTAYQYSDRLPNFFTIEKNKSLEIFKEYVAYGGYPRVVLANSVDEKRLYMGEIYQSYLERDMRDLLNIEKTEALTHLVKILASQIGGLINVSELASTVGISSKTIQKYLWYLQKTYIITKVTPYFRNIRKEITKSSMYYFCDLGLRNYILGFFGIFDVATVGGHVFENFIHKCISEYISLTSTSTHFWRTRDNAEVDFVVDAGANLVPIEVKYTNMKKIEIPRSLRSFIRNYRPKKAYIFHLGQRMETSIDSTSILLIPYFEMIQM